MADAHPLVAFVLTKLVERGDQLILDDAALGEVVDAYGAELVANRAADATAALLTLAMFLDVQRASPAAAQTLLTMCVAAGPLLRELGDARSVAAADQVAGAHAKFAGFTGDERVQKVLESGARPAGTVAASPLARFQLQVPPKK